MTTSSARGRPSSSPSAACGPGLEDQPGPGPQREEGHPAPEGVEQVRGRPRQLQVSAGVLDGDREGDRQGQKVEVEVKK
jgi:hypothetical protein